MAKNFTSSFRTVKEAIHITMSGTFDGTAAYELALTINKAYRYHSEAKKVIIKTKKLTKVLRFGVQVLKGIYRERKIPRELKYEYIGDKICINTKKNGESL